MNQKKTRKSIGYADVHIEDERNSNPIITPCIKKCVLNREGYCTGCFRSLMEIADWSEMNDEERLRIMDKLPKRQPKTPTGYRSVMEKLSYYIWNRRE